MEERQMEKENGQAKKITLKWNFHFLKKGCCYCGECIDGGGMEFIDKETSRPVCILCVEKYAPGLVAVQAEAEAYAKATAKMAESTFNIAVKNFKLTPGDANLLGMFTLDFRGLEIRSCRAFYDRKGTLCFQIREGLELEKDILKKIGEGLAAVVPEVKGMPESLDGMPF
jgi:hypothetical protein